MTKPMFYDCGCCGAYHPADYDGDCREDPMRYLGDDLDTLYGPDGWVEVDPVEVV